MGFAAIFLLYSLQTLTFDPTTDGSVMKNPPASTGDAGSIPGLGGSPGGGNGNPLQYSCLGNPMDRGAWWATVHGITKESDTMKDKSPHTHTHSCPLTHLPLDFPISRSQLNQQRLKGSRCCLDHSRVRILHGALCGAASSSVTACSLCA